MRKFLIERELPGAGRMTDAEYRQVARKSVNVLRDLGADIQWVQSYVTGDKIFCVYNAPDAKAVKEHATKGGFPANSVMEVKRTISPITAETG